MLIDFLAKRDCDLANAEGALLTLYQQLEEKKFEADTLKKALAEEQSTRHRAEEELARRDREVKGLSEKCGSLSQRLSDARHRLRTHGSHPPSATARDGAREDAGLGGGNSGKEKELEERCRHLEQRLAEERRKRRKSITARADSSAGENVPVDSEDIRAKNSALEVQIQLAKDEITARESKIQSLERRCRQLQEKRQKAEAEISASDGYIGELEEKNSKLSAEVESLIARQRSKDKEDEGEVQSLKKRKDALDRKVQQLEGLNQVVEEQMSTLKSKCRRLEEELSKARVPDELLRDLRDNKAALTAELKRSDKEKRFAEIKAHTLEQKCLSLEKQLTEMNRSTDNNSSDRSESSLVKSLREKNKQLEDQILLLRTKSGENQDGVLDLIRASLKSEHGTLADSHNESELHAEERKKLNDMTEELRRTAEALNECRQSSEQLSSRNEQLQLYLEEARTTAVALQQGLTEKKTQCEQISNALLERNKALDSLSLRNETLQYELDESKRKIIELERESRREIENGELARDALLEHLNRRSSLQRAIRRERKDAIDTTAQLLERVNKTSSSIKDLRKAKSAMTNIYMDEEEKKCDPEDLSLSLPSRTYSKGGSMKDLEKLQDELNNENSPFAGLKRESSARSRRFMSPDAMKYEHVRMSEDGKKKKKRTRSRRSFDRTGETLLFSEKEVLPRPFVRASINDIDGHDRPPIPKQIHVVEGDSDVDDSIMPSRASKGKFIVM